MVTSPGYSCVLLSSWLALERFEGFIITRLLSITKEEKSVIDCVTGFREDPVSNVGKVAGAFPRPCKTYLVALTGFLPVVAEPLVC